MKTEMISAVGLQKSFGAKRAVDGVSLSVRAGEIFGLVGPDGAGKTTTLRLLSGGLRLEAGEVTLDGVSLRKNPDEARGRIGYLSQRFSLYEDLTVWENLRFFAEARGIDPQAWAQRSEEMLKFVDLLDFRDRRAGQLSGGMKQKLALAVALVNSPRILLLDEPTTGVDPGTRQDFWQLLLRVVAEEQVAVILCTPYMDEASRCSRIGFLRAGRMIVEGTLADIRSRLDGQVWEVTGSPVFVLAQQIEHAQGVRSVQRFGDRLHVRTVAGMGRAQVEQQLRGALEGAACRLDMVQPVTPLLEDVFIALVEEQE